MFVLLGVDSGGVQGVLFGKKTTSNKKASLRLRGSQNWFGDPKIPNAENRVKLTPLLLGRVQSLILRAKAIHSKTGWWFQICFIFTSMWGNDPI